MVVLQEKFYCRLAGHCSSGKNRRRVVHMGGWPALPGKGARKLLCTPEFQAKLKIHFNILMAQERKEGDRVYEALFHQSVLFFSPLERLRYPSVAEFFLSCTRAYAVLSAWEGCVRRFYGLPSARFTGEGSVRLRFREAQGGKSLQGGLRFFFRHRTGRQTVYIVTHRPGLLCLQIGR